MRADEVPGQFGIVPLILQEEEPAAMRTLFAQDRDVVVWALTGLEVASALWRRNRTGDLEEAPRSAAAESLAQLEFNAIMLWLGL